jgi:RNA polymerase sigma factor (sigma-70 family)
VENIASTHPKTNFYTPETHLKPDEELLLVERWYGLQGGPALERLVRAHWWFIQGFARDYHRASYPFIPLDDLLQAARAGFLRALDPAEENRYRPDHESGARLCTYAPNWMKAAITDFAEKWMQRGFKNVNPGATDISTFSTSTPLYLDDGDAEIFGDHLIDPQWEIGENWWARLSPIEQRIVEGIRAGLSYLEISQEIGCSDEWARRLCQRVGERLTAQPKFTVRDRDARSFLSEYLFYRARGISALRRHDGGCPRQIQLRSKRLDWSFRGPRADDAIVFTKEEIAAEVTKYPHLSELWSGLGLTLAQYAELFCSS